MNDQIKHYSKGLDNISKYLSEHSPNSYPGMSRQVVFQKDKVRVFRYSKSENKTSKVAVLIVYALVNRPHILDLNKDRSFIKGLIDEGQAVYLLDWGYPDEAERHHDLNSYISGYLDSCVDAVRQDIGQEKINLLGVCQGGTLSLCYTVLFQQKIRSLTLLVTPVDFEAGENLLTRWVKYVDIDELVDVLGNVPGSYLDIALQSLKPLSNSVNKYFKFVSSMSNDTTANGVMESFSLMERWLIDRPDQPGEFMRQFVKEFYQSNKLISRALTIGNRRVDLNKIQVPVHNIYATMDHIVPKESSQSLAPLVSSKLYLESEVKSGHIGIFVSKSASKKTTQLVVKWLEQFN